MGLTTIDGLPAHPLLVHLAVVLIPISALLLILAVCWPAARIRLGLLPMVTALVTLVLVPITTDAGQWLKEQLPSDPLVQAHADLGEQMLFWSIGVFVLATAWWVLHSNRFVKWRTDHTHRSGSDRSASPKAWRFVVLTVAVVSVLVAAGSVVQVYRIGESGAKAVWNDQLG